MSSSLKLGRFGPITVSLDYTWLLLFILGVWGIGIVWLPGKFPEWQGLLPWAVSLLAMLLYALCVVAHEIVQTVAAGTGRRNTHLYPFGSIPPASSLDSGPLRSFLAALSGPVFSLALGYTLATLAGGPPSSQTPLQVLQAFGLLVGWMNIFLGLVNLIPGLPFDGGWALSAIVLWFNEVPAISKQTARSVGTLAMFAMVLVAIWRALTAQAWLDSLVLLLLAWSAKEAEEVEKQHQVLNEAFQGLPAIGFMDKTRPEDEVLADQTVAEMVKAHPNYPPDLPLPVLDEKRELVGVVRLQATDDFLQGTWAEIPVSALMVKPNEAPALDPEAPLSQVLTLVEQQSDPASAQPPIPVVENHTLLGSIDPAKIEALEQVDLQFGAEETAKAASKGASRFGPVALGLVLLVAAIFLGDAAIHSNPSLMRNPDAATMEGPVTFGAFHPASDAEIDTTETQITVNLKGVTAVSSAEISLDGVFLGTSISGNSPLEQTASAKAAGLIPGAHTVQVVGVTRDGQTGKATWQFWQGAKSSGTPVEATPTAISAAQSLNPLAYRPRPGARVLAGAGGVQLGLDVSSAAKPSTAQMWLDGQTLEATIVPLSTQGAGPGYSITSTASAVQAGTHHVRVQLQIESSTYTSDWTFSALEPDANNAYFPETGFFVSQPFLAYWQENGGLSIFGYPISDLLQETDSSTGLVYTAQYFERARFELHAGGKVLLGALGLVVQKPEPAVSPVPGARYFPETGHNLSGPFLAYWEEHGGLALFGYPITEERVETNSVDGKQYTVQYFERNRFEYHPEQAGTQFEVQLGMLGREVYAQKSK